jgi:hypothetical protein
MNNLDNNLVSNHYISTKQRSRKSTQAGSQKTQRGKQTKTSKSSLRSEPNQILSAVLLFQHSVSSQVTDRSAFGHALYTSHVHHIFKSCSSFQSVFLHFLQIFGSDGRCAEDNGVLGIEVSASDHAIRRQEIIELLRYVEPLV